MFQLTQAIVCKLVFPNSEFTDVIRITDRMMRGAERRAHEGLEFQWLSCYPH